MSKIVVNKLSHKMTKNKFYGSLPYNMHSANKSTLCVPVTHFLSSGRFLEFSNSENSVFDSIKKHLLG